MGIWSEVDRKLASTGSRVRRSLCCSTALNSVSFGMPNSERRTIESFSCRSSSFRFATVLSFLASSALLTESVSFRSLSCNLCSISCRFFAWKYEYQHERYPGNPIKEHTASLAFLSLSSFLALFSVPKTSPNMVFPRLRSRESTARSSRGRFLLLVAIAAGPVGGAVASCMGASCDSI